MRQAWRMGGILVAAEYEEVTAFWESDMTWTKQVLQGPRSSKNFACNALDFLLGNNKR